METGQPEKEPITSASSTHNDTVILFSDEQKMQSKLVAKGFNEFSSTAKDERRAINSPSGPAPIGEGPSSLQSVRCG
jgi:hypothetical protein